MKKPLIVTLVLLLIACIAGTLGWWMFYSDVPAVRVAKLRIAEFHTSVNTNGRIEPERVFELRAPAAGTCRRLQPREGDRLKQGTPILEINSEPYRADLAAAVSDLAAAEVQLRDVRRGPRPEELNQAEAEIARARLQVDQARQVLQTNEWLLQRNAISRYDVDQSRQALSLAEQALVAATTHRDDIKTRFNDADRKQAEARIAADHARIEYLQDTIARLTLCAPAEGTLYRYDIKDGAYANAGDLIGLFGDLNHLRLKVFVDEPELSKIKPGAELIVTWNAHPGQTWKAKVTRIPPEVVAQGTRSVAEILCEFEDPTEDFMPDVHVDVEIMAGQGPLAAILPRESVYSEHRNQFVWTIRDGKAHKVSVETGRSSPAVIEITKGLSLGDLVVLPDTVPISEGMKVRVAE